MGFMDKVLGRDEAVTEAPCPRCGIPAPSDANECSACGWDLRETFSGEAGSYVNEPSDAA